MTEPSRRRHAPHARTHSASCGAASRASTLPPIGTRLHPPALLTSQEFALREELLDFRRRLLAKPEARKASAYRLVREMLFALGDDERSSERTPFDEWGHEAADELEDGRGAAADAAGPVAGGGT